MTFTLSPQQHAGHDSVTHDNDLISNNGLVNEDVVKYIDYVGFLDDGDFDVWVDPTLPKTVKRFTKKLIRKMDKVTGTDISFTKDESEADVLVYDVENYDNHDEEYQNSAGLQFWENQKAHATWLNKYNDQTYVNKKGKVRLDSWSRRLITHEVLHAFGLSHPFGDGYNSSYDTYDTAMSYNENSGSFNALRPADITTLQQIWG